MRRVIVTLVLTTLTVGCAPKMEVIEQTPSGGEFTCTGRAGKIDDCRDEALAELCSEGQGRITESENRSYVRRTWWSRQATFTYTCTSGGEDLEDEGQQ